MNTVYIDLVSMSKLRTLLTSRQVSGQRVTLSAVSECINLMR